MSWPLDMSGRTTMVTLALPGWTAVSVMPRPCEARSLAYSARGAAEFALCIALRVKRLRKAPAACRINRLLGAGEASGRRGGELGGQSFDRRCELTVIDAAPNQSPRRRLFGRE